MAIVTNFSKIELDLHAVQVLPGFLGGVSLILGWRWCLSMHKSRDLRAFNILNLSGYNIGNFTMPAQGFQIMG